MYTKMYKGLHSMKNIHCELLFIRHYRFKKKILVDYTAIQMYNLVKDIEDYENYLPWCNKSKLVEKNDTFSLYQVNVGFPPLYDEYISKVIFDPFKSIHSTYLVGSRYLNKNECNWIFTQKGNKCETSVNIEYQFSHKLSTIFSIPLAQFVSQNIMKSFIDRAKKIY
ncbi:Coenzyme Q-binding protein COQ10, mitochondrial [Intoshia linei]|uniref:Coenzyme Q-binding protein COQ10, mitochondrial n=1 Tax=Intoshia linei TaxID=1819745 RepID=A0A177AUF6_9BILA|nr:Coenzyme Q-binding protein COQ10, mitochondrial [Intoshia linei]